MIHSGWMGFRHHGLWMTDCCSVAWYWRVWWRCILHWPVGTTRSEASTLNTHSKRSYSGAQMMPPAPAQRGGKSTYDNRSPVAFRVFSISPSVGLLSQGPPSAGTGIRYRKQPRWRRAATNTSSPVSYKSAALFQSNRSPNRQSRYRLPNHVGRRPLHDAAHSLSALFTSISPRQSS